MSNPQSDRNLLFGILALQMDFISRDALIKAMNAWVLEKARPLGDILAEHGALRADNREFVEAMIAKHLEMHDNDPEKSLAAVSSLGWVGQVLKEIPDSDLSKSLEHVSINKDLDPYATVSRSDSDPYATASSVGVSTSAGTRFRILRPHARGGLGEVFVAHDGELHREVALKEIQDRHADNPESRSRFLLEAEITGGLEHPGIVPVYGLGQYADGRPFYAMRFIKGDSLKDAIERFHKDEPGALATGARTVEFRKLLGRYIDVCNAIAYAHSRSVLHRDLKPGNIMLGKYGETLVVDWGLAKAGAREPRFGGPGASAPGVGTETPLLPASGSGSAQTQAGIAIGTPQFMSPEQAAGRLDLLGPASDVYSLGATLYCLLTGKAPFEGKDVGTVLQQVQRGDFPRPKQIKPDVPAPLEAACLKAMALDPKNRYSSPRVLADDIEHWLADEPVSAWPEPVTVRAGRWMRRHKTLVSAAAAAIFVAVIGITAGLFWYHDEQNRRATEQALRKAEAERKIALAEESIRNALDQSDQLRQELHEILKKPGGVFGLLNEPARWQAHIQAAKAPCDRAVALITNAGEEIDPELSKRAKKQESHFVHDEADRLFALRLEKISLEKALTHRDLSFLLNKGAGEYQRAFADAGFLFLKESPQQIAERFVKSPIKEQLVAALDDWAPLEYRRKKSDLAEKLMHINRLAAPDPAWADRLRQTSVWGNQQALNELAKKASKANLSPQLVGLMGSFLIEHDWWFRQAHALYPADFNFNFALGFLHSRKKSFDEAAAFYRVCIGIRPASSNAYSGLGACFFMQESYSDATLNLQKAVELDPENGLAHLALGMALWSQGKYSEAIAAYNQAIKLNVQEPMIYMSLGKAYLDHKKPMEASRAFEKSLELDPTDTVAQTFLGEAQLSMGSFQKASETLQKVLLKISRFDPLYQVAKFRLSQCQQMLSLEKRLPLVLSGKESANAKQILELARMCKKYKERYATAAHLYKEAFKVEPRVAEDWSQWHRCNAACAAALAGVGQGDEAAKLKEDEKMKWRQEAHAWLQADLDQHFKNSKKGNPNSVIDSEERLSHWQKDVDLIGIRDPKELAKLPADEAKQWQKLWADVAGLLKEVRSLTATDTRRAEGTLTEKEKTKRHEFKLLAGRSYIITMESAAFDTYLKLEDSKGKLLAENDDISYPDNLNSRIVFTPTADGVYGIVATSFQQVGRGAYVLTIREFRGKK